MNAERCAPFVGRAALSEQPDFMCHLQHSEFLLRYPLVPSIPTPTARQRPLNTLAPQMLKLLEHDEKPVERGSKVPYGGTKRLSL